MIASGEYHIIHEALSRGNARAASELIDFIGDSNAPQERVQFIVANDFKVFQGFCSTGFPAPTLKLLKDIERVAPDKLPAMLSAGDSNTHERAVLYGSLLSDDCLHTYGGSFTKLSRALLDSPCLNPMPKDVFESCFGSALWDGNLRFALHLLSQYPKVARKAESQADPDVSYGGGAAAATEPPETMPSDSAATVVGEPVPELLTSGKFIHMAGPIREALERRPTSLLKNLQRLVNKNLSLYEHLMEVVRSPSRNLSTDFLKNFSRRDITDIEELSKVVGEACKTAAFDPRAKMLHSRKYLRDTLYSRKAREARAAALSSDTATRKGPKPR